MGFRAAARRPYHNPVVKGVNRLHSLDMITLTRKEIRHEYPFAKREKKPVLPAEALPTDPGRFNVKPFGMMVKSYGEM
jgi:hypothetical protein